VPESSLKLWLPGPVNESVRILVIMMINHELKLKLSIGTRNRNSDVSKRDISEAAYQMK